MKLTTEQITAGLVQSGITAEPAQVESFTQWMSSISTGRYAGAGKLFDHLIARHNFKNDAALSRSLGLAQPVISKIRSGRLPVSSRTILIVHEMSGMPVSEIKALLPEATTEVQQ